MLGTYALSAGCYGAYCGQAQRVRTLIIRDFERAYGVDVLFTHVADSHRDQRQDRRPARDVPMRCVHCSREPLGSVRDLGAVRR